MGHSSQENHMPARFKIQFSTELNKKALKKTFLPQNVRYFKEKDLEVI